MSFNSTISFSGGEDMILYDANSTSNPEEEYADGGGGVPVVVEVRDQK